MMLGDQFPHCYSGALNLVKTITQNWVRRYFFSQGNSNFALKRDHFVLDGILNAILVNLWAN